MRRRSWLERQDRHRERSDGGTKKSSLRFAAFSLAPALIFYSLFFVYPAIDALRISLYDWSGFTPDMDFVGLGNFIEIASDDFVWSVVMRNTLLIIFLGGLGVFAFALLFSNVLTCRLKIRGRDFLKAAIFFPNVVNPIALAVLWSFIYNRQWGLLNAILGVFGLEPRTWTSPNGMFWALLVALIWIYVGFFTVILVSGLQRIPPEMEEAAVIEGATEFQIFVKIKLPMIWDILTTAIVLWGIQSIKQFGFLYAWGGAGNPPPAAQNLAVYMYVMAFGKNVPIFRMGYSAAIGVVMLVMVAVITVGVRRLMRREAIQY